MYLHEPNKYIKDYVGQKRDRTVRDLPPLVYLVEEGSEDFKEDLMR